MGQKSPVVCKILLFPLLPPDNCIQNSSDDHTKHDGKRNPYTAQNHFSKRASLFSALLVILGYHHDAWDTKEDDKRPNSQRDRPRPRRYPLKNKQSTAKDQRKNIIHQYQLLLLVPALLLCKGRKICQSGVRCIRSHFRLYSFRPHELQNTDTQSVCQRLDGLDIRESQAALPPADRFISHM